MRPPPFPPKRLLWGALVLLGCASAGSRPTGSALDRIRARGTLVAGIPDRQLPMSYLGVQGEPEGFDIDLIRAVAAKLGVSASFVTITSQNKIPMLLEGKIDLIAPITQTVPREASIDFSIPVLLDGQALLVRRDSPVRGWGDLKGKRVGVHRGSLAGATLAALVPEALLVFYDDYESMPAAVANREVEGATTGGTWCRAEARQHQDLRVTGRGLTRDVLALGLPRDDSAFRDAVDNALRAIWVDGTYGAIYRRSFGEAPPPRFIEPLPGLPR